MVFCAFSLSVLPSLKAYLSIISFRSEGRQFRIVVEQTTDLLTRQTIVLRCPSQPDRHDLFHTPFSIHALCKVRQRSPTHPNRSADHQLSAHKDIKPSTLLEIPPSLRVTRGCSLISHITRENWCTDMFFYFHVLSV